MEQSTIAEASKEFYYYLGLLSTKFAEVEVNIMSMLGKLVVDEIFLINTIIERNSLRHNIELLKKINLYREFKTSEIKHLIEKISSLRIERNLFIHALWGKPFFKDGKIMISCLEPKVVSNINSYGRMRQSGKEHEFELSYLIKKISEVDEIINTQKSILQKIERSSF